MKGPSRDKYWIRPGIAVIHGDNEGPVMRVERMEGRKRMDPNTGEMKYRLLGVVCRWIDLNGVPHEKTFRTTELRPYEQVTRSDSDQA